MAKIYFHTNYPKDLTNAISLIHSMQLPKQHEIERVSTVASMDFERSVLFLFDHAKRKIDLVTEAHYDSGYRVFAFRLSSTEQLDPFKLSLTLMRLWHIILEKINKENDPFIFTYTYSAKTINKIK